MKKTKRQQNSMVINFIFNISIFTIFILGLLFYVYPNIKEISETKNSLEVIYNNSKQVSKSGISFDEFKQVKVQKKSEISDTLVQQLLDRVDQNFYVNNITNSTDADFDTYLADKKAQLEEKSDEFASQNTDISTILPSYGDYVDDANTVITDFDFTSYLERLFNTFNLFYDGKIGIGDLEPVGVQESSEESAGQALSASLYVTRLKLDVVGRKSDVLNFIHYFENVGSIDISDGEIEIFEDQVLTRFGNPIVLNGDAASDDYNIYLNQLGDIDYIRMDEYIDSSLDSRDLDNQTLSEFVKQTQGSRRYEFEIGLNFYFKGLPKYKVREFITSFIAQHNELKRTVKTEIAILSKKSSPSSEDGQYLRQLKSIDSWLLDTTKQVQGLAKDLQQSTQIEAVYRQSLSLNNDLVQINNLIQAYNDSQQ